MVEVFESTCDLGMLFPMANWPLGRVRLKTLPGHFIREKETGESLKSQAWEGAAHQVVHGGQALIPDAWSGQDKK